ncbi:MAG: hypothetical protein GY749_26940 [Desulfobacteraceae bacterium]|nr:hypothetical protein [Desulfobacteraceae bacterium]
MFDISNFTVADMTACGKLIRDLESKSNSVEAVASSLVSLLYNNFTSQKTNEKDFVLARFGLTISDVIKPDRSIQIEKENKGFNVFYVPDAKGSKFIPMQEEFVVPFGIESVLGFGGRQPNGDVFAIIIFSKTHIPEAAAMMFKTISLSVKAAILMFDNQVFET